MTDRKQESKLEAITDDPVKIALELIDRSKEVFIQGDRKRANRLLNKAQAHIIGISSDESDSAYIKLLSMFDGVSEPEIGVAYYLYEAYRSSVLDLL